MFTTTPEIPQDRRSHAPAAVVDLAPPVNPLGIFFSQAHFTTANAGFTLLELLVGMLLGLMLLSVLASDFATTAHVFARMLQKMEAEQGTRAVLSEFAQEIRQAGACLPTVGPFIALDGFDDGDRDRLTVRMGRVNPETMTCIISSLSVAAPDESIQITVHNSSGFREGDRVFIVRDAATAGYYTIETIDNNTLTLDEPLDGDHMPGSAVYSIEERTYAINDAEPLPILTISVNGDDPVPFVLAVNALNIRYHLSPCPPCAAVDEPADVTEWRRVRRLTVETEVASPENSLIKIRRSSQIHPRNFLGS